MRISSEEIALLKSEVLQLDTSAKIYLFGSRTNDNSRGGDIDLLIVSKTIDRKGIRAIRRAFYNHFGEQKIDLVLDDGEMSDPFVKKIKSDAVLL